MKRQVTMSILLAALIGACSSGNASNGGNWTPLASGTVSGGTAEPASLAVAWVVTSGSPDYVYSFGGGNYDGTKFVVSFSGNPPAEAINSYGVGVGLVLLLTPDASTPPTGKHPLPDSMIAGISAEYAIIWKEPTASGPGWSSDFPTGYACGKCVPATDSSFDSFAVVDCATLEIVVNATSACNWT